MRRELDERRQRRPHMRRDAALELMRTESIRRRRADMFVTVFAISLILVLGLVCAAASDETFFGGASDAVVCKVARFLFGWLFVN